MRAERECAICGGEIIDTNETICADCLARDAPNRPQQPSVNEAADRFRPQSDCRKTQVPRQF